jgi:hypothetical protein
MGAMRPVQRKCPSGRAAPGGRFVSSDSEVDPDLRAPTSFFTFGLFAYIAND